MIKIISGVPVGFDTKELGLPPYTPGKDFVIVNCRICDCEMWIGPKQQKKLKEDECDILCIACIKKMYPKDAINLRNLSGAP